MLRPLYEILLVYPFLDSWRRISILLALSKAIVPVGMGTRKIENSQPK